MEFILSMIFHSLIYAKYFKLKSFESMQFSAFAIFSICILLVKHSWLCLHEVPLHAMLIDVNMIDALRFHFICKPFLIYDSLTPFFTLFLVPRFYLLEIFYSFKLETRIKLFYFLLFSFCKHNISLYNQNWFYHILIRTIMLRQIALFIISLTYF